MNIYAFLLGALLSTAAAAASDIPYMTGGVGKAEREEIAARRSEFNLEIKLALNSGHYIGDVKVIIEDKNGKTILSELSDGPLFYAKLPEGGYKVTGMYQGQTMERAFSIRANTPMREVIFRFEGNEPVIKDDVRSSEE